MPRQFREDSITAETGRAPNGWEIIQVPWPEDDGDFGSVLGVVEHAPTLSKAWVIARRLRRQIGGCWYIRHAV